MEQRKGRVTELGGFNTMSDKQRPSESSGDAEKTKATPIRFFLSSSDVADKEKLTELFRKLLPPREKPR